MKEIRAEEIISAVKKLCIEANYDLSPDIMTGFHRAL